MAFGGEDAESYYDDGLTASMKGDVTHAIQCFEKAVELEPGFLAAHHQLAKCHLRRGDGPRAVAILEGVVQRKPDQVPARLDLGYALLTTGRIEEARRQFEQLVTLDPSNPRAQLGLAQVSFDEGKWQAAAIHADASLGEGKSNFAALYLLGRAAKLAGDAARGDDALKQADALMEKSAELNPDQPEGHYLRGEVSFARDQFSTALEHYRAGEDHAKPDRLYSAFGENFTESDILVKQGLCYQRLGKPDRARDIAERVLRNDPDNRHARALRDAE